MGGAQIFPISKRLTAAIPEMVRVLEKFKEIELTDDVREKLLSMNSSTADRLLRDERKRLELKSRSKTRPGSLSSNRITV